MNSSLSDISLETKTLSSKQGADARQPGQLDKPVYSFLLAKSLNVHLYNIITIITLDDLQIIEGITL